MVGAVALPLYAAAAQTHNNNPKPQQLCTQPSRGKKRQLGSQVGLRQLGSLWAGKTAAATQQRRLSISIAWLDLADGKQVGLHAKSCGVVHIVNEGAPFPARLHRRPKLRRLYKQQVLVSIARRDSAIGPKVGLRPRNSGVANISAAGALRLPQLTTVTLGHTIGSASGLWQSRHGVAHMVAMAAQLHRNPPLRETTLPINSTHPLLKKAVRRMPICFQLDDAPDELDEI